MQQMHLFEGFSSLPRGLRPATKVWNKGPRQSSVIAEARTARDEGFGPQICHTSVKPPTLQVPPQACSRVKPTRPRRSLDRRAMHLYLQHNLPVDNVRQRIESQTLLVAVDELHPLSSLRAPRVQRPQIQSKVLAKGSGLTIPSGLGSARNLWLWSVHVQQRTTGRRIVSRAQWIRTRLPQHRGRYGWTELCGRRVRRAFRSSKETAIPQAPGSYH